MLFVFRATNRATKTRLFYLSPQHQALRGPVLRGRRRVADRARPGRPGGLHVHGGGAQAVYHLQDATAGASN